MVDLKTYNGVFWVDDTECAFLKQDCACVVWDKRSQAESLDVDCACGVSLSKNLIQPFPVSTKWSQSPGLFLQPLDSSFTVVFLPSKGSQVGVLDLMALQNLGSYKTPRPLDVERDSALAHLGFLSPVEHNEVCVEHTSETLTAWLQLTNACNLSCPYCYVRQNPSYMSLQTGVKILERLFANAQQHGFKKVKVKYAGGEPFLSFDTLKALHHVALRLSKTQGIGLDEVVLSNGTLVNDEMLQWLANNHIRLMISLDGIGEVHDRLRYTKSGEGTFSKVVNTIDAALDYGVKLHISTTIAKHNVHNLREVAKFSLERGLLPHFNLVRSSNPELLPATESLITNIRAALYEIEQYPSLDHSVISSGIFDLAVFSPHHYACGASRNYMVVGVDGQLYGCQMEQQHPVTSLLDDGDPLETIRQVNPVHMLPVEQYEECKTCEWRYICAGGCPLLRQAYGRSPYCGVYSAILPELVQCEGRRILKLAKS